MFRTRTMCTALVAALALAVTADVHGQFSSAGGQQDNTPAGPACTIDFGTTADCAGVVGVSGNPLNTQFACQGIVFGDAVDSGRPPTQIQSDSACPSPDGNTHASGVPPFATDFWGQFVDPVTGGQATVQTFSVDVCFIDNAPPVLYLEGYNNEKQVIVSASSTTTGTETLTIVAPPGTGIAYIRVVSSNDPAGLSIDCLQFATPEPKQLGACCLPDLACIEDQTINGCGALGGVGWHPKRTCGPKGVCGTCCNSTDPNLPPSGCLDFQVKEWCDVVQGGFGPGLYCTDNAPCVPALSEWGLIVLVALGLTAGTIVFRRRTELLSA